MQIAIPAVYIVILVVLIIFDYRHYIIPNRVVYPSMVAALALSWWGVGLVNSLIGGAIFFVMMLAGRRMFGFGAGDVKLALLIGLMIGYPFIFLYFGALGLCGMVISGVALLIKRKARTDVMPFGAVMSVMAILILLIGGNVWQAITNLWS